jgi:outer membrane protein
VVANGPAHAGKWLDYFRNYDLNDYSLGVSVSVSQSPYLGAKNSTIAYPYLTSFTHAAFTDDWFLIRGENIGVRYVSKSDWEFGVVGRIQTRGVSTSDNDQLLGIEERRWAIETGPLIGWRGWPVQVHFRHYWDITNRHDGTTSELEFSLPWDLDRGFFVPEIRFSYLSDDYSDYYFGVSEQESTPSRPEYVPGAVTNTWVGFTLGYELTPRWLLSSTVGIEFLDSAVSDSPIVDRDQLWSVRVGLAYNADLFQPRDHDDGQQQPAIEIRLSSFNSSIDTELTRDASDGQPGDELDLEDFLGVADNETIFQLDALFRVAYFHRLELGYFELRRNGQTSLERDINFGEETFVAGTEVNTSIESKHIRLAYSYSLMRDRQKELGVTAGLTYSQFETGLHADDTQQSESVKVKAPLPTMGVFGSVAVGSKWRLGADINVFGLKFDRYEGYMAYLNLGLDRKFGDAIGVGIGYNLYTMRLDAEDEDLRGTFRIRHHGPKLYMTFLF